MTNGKSKKPLRIIGCLQARMNSVRLPNKAIQPILDKTMIEWIIKRMLAAEELDEIVLTITDDPKDDILEKLAKRLNLKYYRGKQGDIVDALYKPLTLFKADALVRVTGDCPLVDPKLIDSLIKIFKKDPQKYDYLTNMFPPTFPDGLDIEIITTKTLKRLSEEIKSSLHKEWATIYIMERPENFRIYNMKNKQNLSSLRFTVDYEEDLKFVQEIYKKLAPLKEIFTTEDILRLLKQKPEILNINKNRIDKTIVGGIRSQTYHKLIKNI